MTNDVKMFKYHTLTNGSKTIKICGVRHVAPQEEFDALALSVGHDYSHLRHSIHLEGVKMPDKYAKGLTKMYSNLADIIGQKLQPKPSVPYTVYDATYGDLPLSSKLTLRVLLSVVSAVGTLMDNPKHRDSLREGFQKAMETPTNPKMPKIFQKVLLDDRNKIAVKHALKDPKNVTLIWGMAHAPGIIELLEKEGYTLSEPKC